jgi:hypothetical protein
MFLWLAKRNVSPTVVIFLLQVEILNHKECPPKALTTQIFLITSSFGGRPM